VCGVFPHLPPPARGCSSLSRRTGESRRSCWQRHVPDVDGGSSSTDGERIAPASESGCSRHGHTHDSARLSLYSFDSRHSPERTRRSLADVRHQQHRAAGKDPRIPRLAPRARRGAKPCRLHAHEKKKPSFVTAVKAEMPQTLLASGRTLRGRRMRVPNSERYVATRGAHLQRRTIQGTGPP